MGFLDGIGKAFSGGGLGGLVGGLLDGIGLKGLTPFVQLGLDALTGNWAGVAKDVFGLVSNFANGGNIGNNAAKTQPLGGFDDATNNGTADAVDDTQNTEATQEAGDTQNADTTNEAGNTQNANATQGTTDTQAADTTQGTDDTQAADETQGTDDTQNANATQNAANTKNNGLDTGKMGKLFKALANLMRGFKEMQSGNGMAGMMKIFNAFQTINNMLGDKQLLNNRLNNQQNTMAA